MNPALITSVRFHNYKAFRQFSISLTEFDVLVGPNNAGKSTVLGAFRVLSEGIRKANSRNAEYIQLPGGSTWGYKVDLRDVPISVENVFHNYDDSEPATVDFRLSNGNHLKLTFPELGTTCYLVPDPVRSRRTTASFKNDFPVRVSFVPILGPVEHEELLYQKEAARLALLTHRASRNFRNIWHHYPEGFADFREMVRTTWPGMDIKPPEIFQVGDKPRLKMFCPEDRVDREIFWAGFGFQVWCQMLTFILQARTSSLLIIDEPDIYLHSDLQRQLISILRGLRVQVILATHSVEIISEVESESLLSIHKGRNSARRITNSKELQVLLQVLGSNANPTLTQLAKTRRVLFVEGKDFQILSSFARKLGRTEVANRADFAVVSVGGFQPHNVKNIASGMEATLGCGVLKAVVFDRDYCSPDELAKTCHELQRFCSTVVIHERKEIENFLLVPEVIDRAISIAAAKNAQRTGKTVLVRDSAQAILATLAESLKHDVFGQFCARRREWLKQQQPGLDEATITGGLAKEFDSIWTDFDRRMNLVSGKEVLARLNTHLQSEHAISISRQAILESFTRSEVPKEMVALIEKLQVFRTAAPPEDPTN